VGLGSAHVSRLLKLGQVDGEVARDHAEHVLERQEGELGALAQPQVKTHDG
jgi:hypothetical protein